MAEKRMPYAGSVIKRRIPAFVLTGALGLFCGVADISVVEPQKTDAEAFLQALRDGLASGLGSAPTLYRELGRNQVLELIGVLKSCDGDADELVARMEHYAESSATYRCTGHRPMPIEALYLALLRSEKRSAWASPDVGTDLDVAMAAWDAHKHRGRGLSDADYAAYDEVRYRCLNAPMMSAGDTLPRCMFAFGDDFLPTPTEEQLLGMMHKVMSCAYAGLEISAIEFSELVGCSERSFYRAVAHLENLGHIVVMPVFRNLTEAEEQANTKGYTAFRDKGILLPGPEMLAYADVLTDKDKRAKQLRKYLIKRKRRKARRKLERQAGKLDCDYMSQDWVDATAAELASAYTIKVNGLEDVDAHQAAANGIPVTELSLEALQAYQAGTEALMRTHGPRSSASTGEPTPIEWAAAQLPRPPTVGEMREAVLRLVTLQDPRSALDDLAEAARADVAERIYPSDKLNDCQGFPYGVINPPTGDRKVFSSSSAPAEPPADGTPTNAPRPVLKHATGPPGPPRRPRDREGPPGGAKIEKTPQQATGETTDHGLSVPVAGQEGARILRSLPSRGAKTRPRASLGRISAQFGCAWDDIQRARSDNDKKQYAINQKTEAHPDVDRPPDPVPVDDDWARVREELIHAFLTVPK